MIQLDSSQPINWQHPLNRGLIAWFLAGVQGRTFGASWFDVVLGHEGVLNADMDPKLDWVRVHRAGGNGALEFDGANDAVVIPKALSFRGQTAATVAAWFKPTAVPTANAALYYESQLTASSTRFAIFQLTTGFLQGVMRDSAAAAYLVNDTAALTNGVWYHVALTVDATTDRLVLYRDGVERGVDTTAKAGFGSDIPGNDLQIGRYFTSANTSLKGQVDDVRLWCRALSAAEVKAYYELSRQEYMGLFNRVDPLVAFVPTAPAAGMLHTNLSGNLQSLFGGMQN